MADGLTIRSTIGTPAQLAELAKLTGRGGGDTTTNTTSAPVFQTAAPTIGQQATATVTGPAANGSVFSAPAPAGQTKQDESIGFNPQQLREFRQQAFNAGKEYGLNDGSQPNQVKEGPAPAHLTDKMGEQIKLMQQQFFGMKNKTAEQPVLTATPTLDGSKPEVEIQGPPPQPKPAHLETGHKPVHPKKAHKKGHKPAHHGPKMTDIERHVLGGVKAKPSTVSHSALQNHVLRGAERAPSTIGLPQNQNKFFGLF